MFNVNIITINYKPIKNIDIIHTKKVQMNKDNIAGALLMAKQIAEPDQIVFLTQDGRKIVRANQRGPYTAMFGTNLIKWGSLDFIAGAIQICLLMGITPREVITDSTVKIEFNDYIGKMTLPNTYGYVDGTVMETEKLKANMDYKLFLEIDRILRECFPEAHVPGVAVPCDVYLHARDPVYENVTAMVMISKVLPKYLEEHKGSIFIFNVCTDIKNRGQGISKTLMVSALNNLIATGHKTFLLEVKPDNTIAYNLYYSLGFIMIGSVQHLHVTSHLLKLDIP